MGQVGMGLIWERIYGSCMAEAQSNYVGLLSYVITYCTIFINL